MKNDNEKVDLSIYLSKKSGGDVTYPIKTPGSVKRFDLDLGSDCSAVLFVRSPKRNSPAWAKFFYDYINVGEFGHNSSTGAVLSVSLVDATFLLAFGQGWHCIDSAKIVSDFGLKTALNLLDPLSIRSIDKSSLEAQPKQLREQSGKATEIQYFGIDIERDLLRAVTGKPKVGVFGNRISGFDSLKLSLDLNPASLPELLRKLIVAYRGDAYKTGPFAWIDHIGQVRDPEVQADLNEELIQRLNAGQLNGMWLSVPEIIDWNRVVGFRYSMGRREPRVYDIRVLDFLETFKGEAVTVADLMRRKIYCVDEDDKQVLERPAYNYIYAELNRGSEIYLLNNGNWYRVQDNYVETINEAFDGISSYDKDFPVYDDDTEGEYNARVFAGAPAEYVLLDKDLAYIPGAASPVEICDLYRSVKEFVHVKRYGGSSVLSHLFNQGLVSGEIFQINRHYREIVNEKLPGDRKIQDPISRPLQMEYRVVYAIISESVESLSIPFFSKVSLKHCASRLEAMGFCVMLAKISVADDRKFLKIFSPASDKT